MERSEHRWLITWKKITDPRPGEPVYPFVHVSVQMICE